MEQLAKWAWIVAVFLVASTAVTVTLHASAVAVFFLSCVAMIPLAWLMGRATERVAAHAGPRIGGMMSATFGNAAELIIGLFALQEGLGTLVKASITGSILGNLLFVLGVSFFVGGIRHPIQRFNIRAARNHSALLMLGVGIAFVLPAFFAHNSLSTARTMSAASAVVSFVLYLAGLLFMLFTHRDVFQSVDEIVGGENERSDDMPRLWVPVISLLISTVFISFESDWLVGSVKTVGTRLGLSQVFIGVIVVAVIGNAAEHASAVWMAWKNRMDISLEIAVGSSLQVAMFVAPVLFAASFVVGHPMSLLFNWPELASMTAAVILVAVLMIDGESNWLEGALAVGAYAVMAVGFFVLPSV